jgi:hypothetical protein
MQDAKKVEKPKMVENEKQDANTDNAGNCNHYIS